MILSDNFFKKVENKTKVDKATIVNLASKLQKNNLKDEATLRDVIHQLSGMAGKEVSKEQRRMLYNRKTIPKNC